MTQPPDTIEVALAEHLDRESDVPAWFRQTVERTFKVGDRVRIRLSGECRFWAHDTDGAGHSYEHGAVATVTRLVPADEWNGGHEYEVTFDRPWPHPPGLDHPRLIGSAYCAAEMEPVEPAPEARPSGAAGEGRDG